MSSTLILHFIFQNYSKKKPGYHQVALEKEQQYRYSAYPAYALLF